MVVLLDSFFSIQTFYGIFKMTVFTKGLNFYFEKERLKFNVVANEKKKRMCDIIFKISNPRAK